MTTPSQAAEKAAEENKVTCVVCGYQWPRGATGKHSCVRKLLDTLTELDKTRDDWHSHVTDLKRDFAERLAAVTAERDADARKREEHFNEVLQLRTEKARTLQQVQAHAATIEGLRREIEEINASLPWSTNRTRNEASKLLGEVLRHVTDEKLQASHGCVEVTNAIQVVDSLIGDNAALRARVAELGSACDCFKSTSDMRTGQIQFLRGDNERLQSELATVRREKEEFMKSIHTEATAPTAASYEYDQTPTASERLQRIAALATPKPTP